MGILIIQVKKIFKQHVLYCSVIWEGKGGKGGGEGAFVFSIFWSDMTEVPH